jgi:hypothetical protein
MDDNTIVDGDFAIIENQSQLVVKALFKETPTSLPSINTRPIKNRVLFLPLWRTRSDENDDREYQSRCGADGS